MENAFIFLKGIFNKIGWRVEKMLVVAGRHFIITIVERFVLYV